MTSTLASIPMERMGSLPQGQFMGELAARLPRQETHPGAIVPPAEEAEMDAHQLDESQNAVKL